MGAGWAWLDTATSGFRHHGMFARSVPTPGSGGTKLQAQGLRLEEGRESCQTSNLRPEAQASQICLGWEEAEEDWNSSPFFYMGCRDEEACIFGLQLLHFRAIEKSMSILP